MTKNLTGPRAVAAFKLETLQTEAGRAQHVQSFCAAARRSFETHGTVHLAWVWVRQSPNGATAPAVLSVELTGAKTLEQVASFEARLARAAELGKALAVATATEQADVVLVSFEASSVSEAYGAPILTSPDPLQPSQSRRVLQPFHRADP